VAGVSPIIVIKVNSMKIAISVDDSLITEADGAAREMGVSRSRLFSLALESYLRNREHGRMLEQLNRVYTDEAASSDKLMAKRVKAKFREAIVEKW
jgi:metal-responsive CopG/Arc/MetJ family transcriptional regulator